MLEAVKTQSQFNRDEWFRDFIIRLGTIKTGLEEAGVDPEKYLRLGKSRGTDADCYKDRSYRQFQRDYRRANNRSFEARYTKGFEFFSVPGFRGSGAHDGGSFLNFLENFCNSLVDGIGKPLCKNKLVKVVRREFNRIGVDLEEMTGEELYHAIRQYWPRIGPNVRAFHRSK